MLRMRSHSAESLRRSGIRVTFLQRARHRPLMLRLFLVVLIMLCGVATAGAQSLPQKTLSECIAIALQNHPTLKAATASIAAAGERVWEATAPYLPQLNAVWSTERRMTNVGAQTGTSTQPTQTLTFYNGGVSFSQLLFDFGQTLASIRAAQALQ